MLKSDKEYRVRNFLNDEIARVESEPQYIKIFDKLAFTLGVLNLSATQYFVFEEPGKFWMFYSFILPLLLLARYKHFKSNKMQYFLLDFCYAVNIATLLHLFCFYDTQYSERFFRVAFILTTGPLPAAIPVWLCSLVFHDVDRTISVYIHTLPMCLYYTLKRAEDKPRDEPLVLIDYVYATLFYFCWQCLYLIKTEVLDRDKLAGDSSLQTSLRWLSSNTRNALSGSCLRLFRRLKLFSEDETFSSQSLKTKCVFVFSQLIFTWTAMIPTYWCWSSPGFNLFYICLIFTIAIYLGGSYYIDVFSRTYTLALEKAAERAANRDISQNFSDLDGADAVYSIDD